MKSFKAHILLTEAKDRFIKKNRNFSDEQKDEIIKFFSQNRQAEGDVDWNRSAKMTYDDFFEVMSRYKSGRKGNNKSTKMKCPSNLKGLKKGEDYVHLKINNPNYCTYIPLHYEAAKLFNTERVIGTSSRPWCIGDSRTDNEWINHCVNKEEIPVYVVGNDGKWVVMIQSNNDKVEIWDENNRSPRGYIPDFDPYKELLDSKKNKLYNEVRNTIIQNYSFIKNAEISKDVEYYYKGKDLVWVSGTWISGTWEDGNWKDGAWRSGDWQGGVWEKGIWEDGYWHNGYWKSGTWYNGIWYRGTWKDGIWYNGEWKSGIWEGGTWLGGEWKSGTWITGYDKDGNVRTTPPNTW